MKYHVYDRLLEGFIVMDLPSRQAALAWINRYVESRPGYGVHFSICPVKR